MKINKKYEREGWIARSYLGLQWSDEKPNPSPRETKSARMRYYLRLDTGNSWVPLDCLFPGFMVKEWDGVHIKLTVEILEPIEIVD